MESTNSLEFNVDEVGVEMYEYMTCTSVYISIKFARNAYGKGVMIRVLCVLCVSRVYYV